MVISKPRQELRAKGHLENQGGEVFFPQVRFSSKQKNKQQEALFPNYLFLRMDEECALIHKVRSTLGVSRLLSFNGKPAVIDDALIDDLKCRTESIIQAPTFIEGQAVALNKGPFAHYHAIFKTCQGNDRAVIFLSLLGQQNELLVSLNQLYKR